MGASSLYYDQAVINDAPLEFWPLSSSGAGFYNKFAPTVAGGVSFNQAFTGTRGNPQPSSTSFDGATGTKITYSTFANFVIGPTTGITLECWFFSSSNSASAQYPIDNKQAGSSNPGFNFAWTGSAGSMTFGIGTNSTLNQVQTSGSSLINGWHHLVATLTRNPGGRDLQSIYVDGVINNTNLLSAVNSGFAITSTLALIFGQFSPNGTSPNGFIGNLYGMALYLYTLSASQVAAHFACPFNIITSTPTSNLSITQPIMNPNPIFING